MFQPTFSLSEAEFLEEVERIKARYPATPPIGKTDPEQIERLSGLFADDPLFDAAVRAGQEWRNADRPSDEQDELLASNGDERLAVTHE